MLQITFLPLCVGRIYVAMAARRQSETTVAPVGGNITFAYESSERSQEFAKPRIGMAELCRHVIGQIAERECFRFHFQVNLRANVRGVQRDMPDQARMVLMGCRPPERQNLCVVNIKKML
jgi:hypothetical protein